MKPCIIWGRAAAWSTKAAVFGLPESLLPPAAASPREAALPPGQFPFPSSSALSNYKSPNENETRMSYITRRGSTAREKEVWNYSISVRGRDMSPHSPGENLKVHNFFHSQTTFKGQLLEAERKHHKKNRTVMREALNIRDPFLIHQLGLAWRGVHAEPWWTCIVPNRLFPPQLMLFLSFLKTKKQILQGSQKKESRL